MTTAAATATCRGLVVVEAGEHLGAARIEVAGAQNEIHRGSAEGIRVTFAGRLYEPFRVDPGCPPRNFRDLACLPPERLHGSFVLVRAHPDGSVEVHTDKYGLRPVFYQHRNGVVRIATHVRGLDLTGAVVDPEALLHLYSFSVTPNDRHLLAGVHKIPPGATLRVRGGRATVQRYFNLADVYEPERFAEMSRAELCEEVDARLKRAVRRRIPSSGRVALALSGGVDSGYIAQKLVEAGADVAAYTLAFGESYDEFARTDRLCGMLGIEARHMVVGDGVARENFEDANRIASEPAAFNNATLGLLSAAAAAHGIDTLIDGDGADRLFLGMTRYLQLERAIRVYRRFRKTGLLPLVTPALGFLPGRKARALRHAFRQWRAGLGPYPERRVDRGAPFDASFERRVYGLGVARHSAEFERSVGSPDFGTWFSYLSTQMCPELFFRDPAELHGASGVYAVPGYWDDELVELAFSLPTSWKLRAGKTKYILREAAATRIDRDYWMLPKIGFQDSFLFATATPDGKVWLAEQRERVRAGPEYALLQDLLPDGVVQPDRLIGLTIWKHHLGLPAS